MVFLRMGLGNVARNWNRTGMIILSMMVASAFMTLTLTFSSGYAAGVDLPWRQLVGADILIYPNRFVFTGTAPAGGQAASGGEAVPGAAGVGAWEWRRLDDDQPTDALLFHPRLATGYLSPGGAPPAAFDLAALPALLPSVEGVDSIEPARLLRAYLVLEEDGAAPRRVPVILRGRDIAADAGHFAVPGAMAGGRYFRPSQDGEWVAIINGAGAGLGPDLPRTGGRLVLEVPAIRGSLADGTPVLDQAAAQTFYFLDYGQFRLPLGQVPLQIDVPAESLGEMAQAGSNRMWPVAIDAPEVWVPDGTFDLIYEQVAGRPFASSRELRVRVTDMAMAKTVAARLAQALPDCTVLTVPQEVGLAGIRYEAHLTSVDPWTVEVSRRYFGGSTLSLDVKSELAGAAFVVAGLLIVANMYILVTQRRREIGTLKAIGAAGRDILVLFLVETLGYSLAGSLAGFFGIRLLTLLSLFSSPGSLVEGAVLTLRAGVLVVGLTVGTALVFGFLPAWEAARATSATLLGDA